MKERDEGANARLEQAVDEAAVEGQALGVRLSAAGRLDARPGHGESIGLEAEALHQRDVFAKAMIVVAGDVAVAGVEDFAGLTAETIPDRLAAAALVRGALDLKRGGPDAPEKSGRELHFGHIAFSDAFSDERGAGLETPAPARRDSIELTPATRRVPRIS